VFGKPSKPYQQTAGVYLMPGYKQTGAVENLLLEALQGQLDSVQTRLSCIDGLVSCLGSELFDIKDITEQKRQRLTDKLKLQVFYSTYQDGNDPLSARKFMERGSIDIGYDCFTHECFSPLNTFLTAFAAEQ
jgi:hypothetical protein